MPTILILSLTVSAVLMTISVLVPSRDRTDWPASVIAHLFWPMTLVLVAIAARRAARDA